MVSSLTIWTARVDYQKRGNELVMNTTATKGKGLGKLFAPPWKLVETYKAGFIEWEEYERRYIDILRDRYLKNKPRFKEVCEAGEVVLLCFCPNRSMSGKKCHRYLLADVLEKAAKGFGIKVTARRGTTDLHEQSHDREAQTRKANTQHPAISITPRRQRLPATGAAFIFYRRRP